MPMSFEKELAETKRLRDGLALSIFRVLDLAGSPQGDTLLPSAKAIALAGVNGQLKKAIRIVSRMESRLSSPNAEIKSPSIRKSRRQRSQQRVSALLNSIQRSNPTRTCPERFYLDRLPINLKEQARATDAAGWE